MKYILVLFLLVFVWHNTSTVIGGNNNATGVTLAWDDNSDASVRGYRIYIGVTSNNYTNFIVAGNVLTLTVTNLQPNTTYYFAATAYNAIGVESPRSNEVTYTTPSSTNSISGPSNLNVIQI